MANAEIANERDLVLRGGQEMRRALMPQDFLRMRIEGDHHGSSICGARVLGGRGDNGLVPKMNAVENTNCQKERPAQLLEFGNRSENLHRRITLPAFGRLAGGTEFV